MPVPTRRLAAVVAVDVGDRSSSSASRSSFWIVNGVLVVAAVVDASLARPSGRARRIAPRPTWWRSASRATVTWRIENRSGRRIRGGGRRRARAVAACREPVACGSACAARYGRGAHDVRADASWSVRDRRAGRAGRRAARARRHGSGRSSSPMCSACTRRSGRATRPSCASTGRASSRSACARRRAGAAAPSSTSCASTRSTTSSAASTGRPRRAPARRSCAPTGPSATRP